MVSFELSPLVSCGGLGRAVRSLGLALSAAGHDVRFLIPRHGCLPTDGLKTQIAELPVPILTEDQKISIYASNIPESQVPVYLVDHKLFSDREGIYGPGGQLDYPDNPERSALFCRAAFQLCRALQWFPDVMNLHDWPAALCAVYLKHLEGFGGFRSTVSVLSVHNVHYQGIYPKQGFEGFRLPWELYHGAGFEDYDRLNLLKAGIQCADAINTVSPSYSREIQTPEYGLRLDGLLRHRSRDLVGILNGIDSAVWDPQSDPHISQAFSIQNLEGKAACKAALQREFGLEEDARRPLIAFSARLSPQKGIEELFSPGASCAYAVCSDMDLQFIAAGRGESWCEEEFASLGRQLPNFRGIVGFDPEFEHRILAGADYIIMPSRYEPCGLSQMYAMRYATLPIARRTGGLADTVRNYNQDSGDGTGFLFDDLSPKAIYNTVGWAVWAWYNRPEHIVSMRLRAMSQDFSWTDSSREYAALFANSLAKKA